MANWSWWKDVGKDEFMKCKKCGSGFAERQLRLQKLRDVSKAQQSIDDVS